MTDDRSNGSSSGGFDDWLDDEPGPPTDPYESLAADEPDEDIDEWLEFADQGAESAGTVADDVVEGEADAGPAEDQSLESESSDVDEIAELEEVSVEESDDEGADGVSDDHDDTGELEAVQFVDPSPEVDDAIHFEEHLTEEIEAVAVVADDDADDSGELLTEEIEAVAVVAGDDADDSGELLTEEIEAVAVVADDEEVSGEQHAVELTAVTDDPRQPDEILDAGLWTQEPGGEADEPEAGASLGFGQLWDSDDERSDDSSTIGTESDLFDISRDEYLQTATREHAGLAEDIALADDEETEQVALAAPIPGLDATVVGFEDVVEAEGHGKVRARASGDLVARVITALVLVGALAASLFWRPALVLLALVVFVIGAGEFYTALARSGRRPIALFGFIGIIAASLGAFFFSALWIPIAFVLATTLLLLFYAVVPGKEDPLGNIGLTITVMVWAGLGSFAMLIIKSESYQVLVFGLVAAVAAMDIAQYFFGRALGRHKLSPWVSPKKTIEGLVAGVLVALTVGALLHFFKPFELTSGLAIGVAVAVFSPVGDLAMSAAKRSLGMKDMGSVLPGHGGFMDRVDGLLFVIPVAWAIFLWAGIL